MKKTVINLLILFSLMSISASIASARDANIVTIATMVIHLNHYPSNSEKQTLARIVHDHHATAGESALAGALMRMQHSIQGDDVAALHALISDKQSSHDEQELATILLGIHHHPSAAAQQRLQSLTHPSNP